MPTDPFDRIFRTFFGGGGMDERGIDDQIDALQRGLHQQHAPYQDRTGNGSFRSFRQSSSYSMHQDDKQVTIQMEVPGMDSKDILVEVTKPDDDLLPQEIQTQQYVPPQYRCTVDITAGGVGQQPMSLKPTRGHQMEGDDALNNRSVPKFQQRFQLGNSSVDCNRISAELSRGILTLTAPKKEEKVVTPKLSTRVIDVEEK